MSASIGNGGVSDSERTRSSSARSSIAPVARFSLTAPERAVTLPFTAITNSLLSFSAFAKPSLSISPSSKITCLFFHNCITADMVCKDCFLMAHIFSLLHVHCKKQFRYLPMSSFLSRLRRHKLLLAFLPALIFLFCSVFYYEINHSFVAFCDTVFRNEITENTLNLHYTLENPEILNLSDPDVSFGSTAFAAALSILSSISKPF